MKGLRSQIILESCILCAGLCEVFDAKTSLWQTWWPVTTKPSSRTLKTSKPIKNHCLDQDPHREIKVNHIQPPSIGRYSPTVTPSMWLALPRVVAFVWRPSWSQRIVPLETWRSFVAICYSYRKTLHISTLPFSFSGENLKEKLVRRAAPQKSPVWRAPMPRPTRARCGGSGWSSMVVTWGRACRFPRWPQWWSAIVLTWVSWRWPGWEKFSSRKIPRFWEGFTFVYVCTRGGRWDWTHD